MGCTMEGINNNKEEELLSNFQGKDLVITICIIIILGLILKLVWVEMDWGKKKYKTFDFSIKPKSESGSLKENLLDINKHFDVVSVPEGIFKGEDSRTIVRDTAKFPYSAIAYMDMKFESRKSRKWYNIYRPHYEYFRGTGFLTTDCKFYTCAHNIKDLEDRSIKHIFTLAWNRLTGARKNSEQNSFVRNGGRTATSVTLYFGQNTIIPLKGDDFTIPGGYEPMNAFDIASADLSSYKDKLPEKCFNIDFSDSFSDNTMYRICGCPGDKSPEGSMWEVSCTVSLSGSYLTYTGATFRGNSGSPVFRIDQNNESWVSAVHVGESINCNLAVLIRNQLENERNPGMQLKSIPPTLTNTGQNSKESPVEHSQACNDQKISDEEWDRFVKFVEKLLEAHPITQADAVIAYNLGGGIYSHYDAWKSDGGNFLKPLKEKVRYLLTYWKEKNSEKTLKSLIIDLDNKLRDDSSFNLMRGKIKSHFNVKI